jgi:ATP-dependent DNA helicase RecG
MFTVIFRRPFDFKMWVNKWVNNLSEKQIILLKAIHENKEIKKSTLQQLTDFSATAIDKNLGILKKEGLLEREGTKGGLWILHYIDPKVGE